MVEAISLEIMILNLDIQMLCNERVDILRTKPHRDISAELAKPSR